MRDLTIQVENLTKQYRIVAGRARHDMLRDRLVEGLAALLRPRRGAGGTRTIAALDGVSFEVRQGEILGIVGKNGAGKSTLLKLLSRVTEPTRGRAVLYGRVGSLLEVGTGFHPELSGRENIFLNGAILGMPKAEIRRKLDEIVAFAEIDAFLDTPVKRYSSGMYVRLAFAVAAHLEPEILLLDEVLAVGDLRFQQKCLEHAKRLQAAAATVLFVSHSMFAIKSMCSRVLYLAGGRVQADGSPDEVIPRYEQESQLSSTRWDGGEDAELITGIELLDAEGMPRRILDHGEPLCIRLHYDVPHPIRDANVVVALVRADNVTCCNYSTHTDGLRLPRLAGAGTLELRTPPLRLAADVYTVHVLIWDRGFHRLYSAQYGTSFHVRHPLYSSAHFGVFHESGRWTWEPGAGAGRPGEGRALPSRAGAREA